MKTIWKTIDVDFVVTNHKISLYPGMMTKLLIPATSMMFSSSKRKRKHDYKLTLSYKMEAK